MKSLIQLAALLLSIGLCAPAAQAASPPSGQFGLGLGGGLGVSGLSGKYYMGEAMAFQGIVGLRGSDGLGVGLDYLLERPSFAGGDPVSVGWNYGVGGTVVLDDNPIIGASGIVGLELLLQPLPIDFVLEWRPGILIYSGNGNSDGIGINIVNFSGHIRYYFG